VTAHGRVFEDLVQGDRSAPDPDSGGVVDSVADRRGRADRAEFARTRIAWTGSTDPDTPGSYLGIDGPRLWIEFSNVGRFGNGDNHYHSVYRDKQADYLG
jgi:hypothetical protein